MFHVQTEDSGITSPHIYTHLFHAGVIIASKKLEYDAEADGDIVKALMQAQHKSVMKELKHGAFDEKIIKYLGEAPASSDESLAVPTDISGDEAATTLPTTPPPIVIDVLEDASAASSLPYIMMDVVTDQGSAVTSGTLSGRRPDAAPVSAHTDEQADLDDDDDINGLLNRLRADTPLPELIEEPAAPQPPPLPGDESPGAWLVSRPGQKERPFDRSAGVPVEVGDEVARRILTPPSVDVAAVAASASAYSQHSRKGTLAANPVPAPPVTAPVGAPVGSGSTRRGSQPPAPRLSGPAVPVKPPSQPPVARPVPTAPTRAYAPVTSRPPVPPPLPRSNPPPPVLPRPVSPSSQQPAVSARPSAAAQPASRSQPLAPVLPRPPVPPPLRQSQPATTAPLRSQPVHVGPRRSQDSVVVARPAVVIGAPPTVIGAESARRPHGREPTPPPVQPESIFGQDLISEKSLDEVIMAYLSEDSNDD